MNISLANHIQKILAENLAELTWTRSWPSLASCYRAAKSIPGCSRKAVAALMQKQASELRDKVRHRAWLREPAQYGWRTSTPTAKELVEFAKTDLAVYHARWGFASRNIRETWLGWKTNAKNGLWKS